ncbi:MAG: shikimate dehydrogenase [Actinomycetota bacterium]|nr:shikimate dehydrogenase [Actinomycetota bacterium]
MLRSRAASRFVGILGWPLEHTLSPAIHSAAFRFLGMDWAYLVWPVTPDALGDAVAGLRALGALGSNVTMPHKESIVEFLDQVSGDARAVGAVNTVQRLGDRLIGHNTDVDGFTEFLSGDAGVDVAGSRALVLGAGGAARAVVKALADLGSDEIVIAARQAERGARLVELGGGRGRAAAREWDEATRQAAGFDVVVNATPVGTGRGDPLSEVEWQTHHVVVDLVYDPPTTALVARARAAGARAWGGVGMLVRQAAASFQLWTGQDPPIETMSAAAIHSIGAHGSGSDL